MDAQEERINMICPNCKTSHLRAAMTKQGVQVDYCETCRGIWLDRGEIFHFTKNARAVNAKLHQALRTGSPGKKLSPRARKLMLELTYPQGPQFDFCQDSGGLWFDANELDALLETERDLRMAFAHNGMDASSHDQPTQAKASTPQPRRFHDGFSNLLEAVAKPLESGRRS